MGKLRRGATSLALIVVVALGMRVLFTADYIGQNPRQGLAVKPFLLESGNIAYAVATGAGFSNPFHVATGPTAWLTPVYPLVLAGVMRVFGLYTFRSYLAAVGLNILFVTAACVPIFFIGKRIGGAGVGAGAAWLWAVFPNAILLTFESLWDASLDALLAALILWATLALEGSRNWSAWVGYGLLWGLALMTNPTLAPLLPLLLSWLVYRARKHGRAETKRGAAAPAADAPPKRRTGAKESLARPALALGVAVLCCVPWTIRNYREFHRFVPLRSVLGLQLWLGNNPNARSTWRAELHPIFNAGEREKYIQMGEISYMQGKMDAALEFIERHPLRDASLVGSRFVAIWMGGTPTPARDFLENSSIWFRYVLLFNFFVALGTLGGIVMLFRRGNRYAYPVAVFPVVFPCAYYLTLAMPRYRFPIDPMVMLLTAAALAGLSRGGRRQLAGMGQNES